MWGKESLVEIPEGCLGDVGPRFAADVLFEGHIRGDGSAENVVWEAKCLAGIATNLRTALPVTPPAPGGI